MLVSRWGRCPTVREDLLSPTKRLVDVVLEYAVIKKGDGPAMSRNSTGLVRLGRSELLGRISRSRSVGGGSRGQRTERNDGGEKSEEPPEQ